ncbi:hypothetical protein CNMCM5793_001766 [Aspergillus hiratsukae]|uniref:EKC/KEOPS complex subunit BUD32 n=1 Tax=Aspergillus hiratsukae TaxID=1194566 RepID=A0A8H6UG60_9EURO|nr:hypothetical protein CNMCM5793_001766 [Aspergillus hiratsukae]
MRHIPEKQGATAASREADASGRLPQAISYITVPGLWERREHNIPKPQPGQVVYITKGKFLAWGGTAILERLPSGDVIKTPKPHPDFHEDHCRNMRLEAQIYQTLGENSRVPRLINWNSDTCCLTLEYMDNGDIREYIRQHGQDLTDELRLHWAKQAAEGLAALHSIGVIHCDISPRNFLLDFDLNLKISDFGGASLSGSEPSAVRHPEFYWDAPPTFGDDIFSLGSLIYFIMTGSYPYADRDSDEVEKLYVSQHFPDVTYLRCGSIIYQCWTRNVLALEVYSHIKMLEENRQL